MNNQLDRSRRDKIESYLSNIGTITGEQVESVGGCLFDGLNTYEYAMFVQAPEPGDPTIQKTLIIRFTRDSDQIAKITLDNKELPHLYDRARMEAELKAAAKESLLIQDACNIGGFMISFHEAVKVLQRASHLLGRGTDWINQHPIVRMYTSKLIHLARFDNDPMEFSKAHDVVEALAKGDFTHIDKVA